MVEAVHKEIQRYVFNNFAMKESDFDLKETLLEANYYYGHKFHSSTGFKPVDIKDCTDENILNKIKKNSIKSMEKTIYKNHDNLLEAGEKLLLREHFTINNNKITVSKSNGSIIHNIPCLFLAYCKDSRFVKIEVKCNYKKLLLETKFI